MDARVTAVDGGHKATAGEGPYKAASTAPYHEGNFAHPEGNILPYCSGGNSK